MISNKTYNNFSGGELTPEAHARTDRPFYETGVEVMRNFIPKLTGGAFYRWSFPYINHTRLNQRAWKIDFQFNAEQSYTLEFTNLKMRVQKDGGAVLEDNKVITGISQASPGVVTSAGHGFITGDEVYIDEVVGMDEMNGQFFLVTFIDVNTFSLTDIDSNAIDTTGFEAYVSGGVVGRVYEIDTPYLEGNLWQIKKAQTADVMYLAHPSYQFHKLSRFDHNDWTLEVERQMESAVPITAITQANPGVVTSAAHGLVSGDRVRIANVVGMTELNDTEFLVVWIDANTFSLTTLAGVAIDTTAFSEYSKHGVVGGVASTGKVITAITQADPGVITSVAHGFFSGDQVYISAVVGMTELNGNYYWVTRIDADTFSLRDQYGADIDTSGFTAYGSAGLAARLVGPFAPFNSWPGAVGFYGGRVFTGGSDNDPDSFKGSRGPDPITGESRYLDYTVGTAATDSVSFVLSSQTGSADRIRWFSGNSRFLIIGTFAGLSKANGGVDGTAITPSAISVLPISSYGVADINPVFVGQETVYLEAGGLTLRSFEYDLLKDSYTAFDKNVIADEITTGGIVQIAVTQGRPNLVWGIRDDGVLLSTTFIPKEEVAGWARQYVGGNGEVISAASDRKIIGFDRLVLVVERTINGATRRFIEYQSADPQIPDRADFFTGVDNKAADEARFRNTIFELQKTFNRLDSSLTLDTTQIPTLTLSAVTGLGITATASAAIFKASDVGRPIFIKYITGEETGTAYITGFTSSTVVTINIKQDFSSLVLPTEGWYLLSNTVKGLAHLEGETVGVLTDGGVHPVQVVANGQITLDYYARYIQVGYKYLGVIRTTQPEFGAEIGVAAGRPKNILRLVMKFRNTMGGKFGTALNALYSLQALVFRREGADYTDRAPLLYTGELEATSFDDWDIEKHIWIVQDEPQPLTLLSYTPFMDVTVE